MQLHQNSVPRPRVTSSIIPICLLGFFTQLPLLHHHHKGESSQPAPSFTQRRYCTIFSASSENTLDFYAILISWFSTPGEAMGKRQQGDAHSELVLFPMRWSTSHSKVQTTQGKPALRERTSPNSDCNSCCVELSPGKLTASGYPMRMISSCLYHLHGLQKTQASID